MKNNHKKLILGGLVGVAAVTSAVFLGAHRNPQLYPNPQYTPGVIATTDFNELTAVSSCGTYSKCHRQTTEQMKAQVCQEYPDNCKVPHEIDHFCPLALGCADDVHNLWAQPEHVLINGVDYGFHTKDKLEAFLAAQMKAGKIAPTDAQQCLLKDWVSCYQKYLGKNFNLGSVGSDPDNQ